MAANSESVVASARHAVFGELAKNWGWLLAFGIVFIILGTIGLGMTFALTLASVFLFGILYTNGCSTDLIIYNICLLRDNSFGRS